jgi:hypothetical protein
VRRLWQTFGEYNTDSDLLNLFLALFLVSLFLALAASFTGLVFNYSMVTVKVDDLVGWLSSKTHLLFAPNVLLAFAITCMLAGFPVLARILYSVGPAGPSGTCWVPP